MESSYLAEVGVAPALTAEEEGSGGMQIYSACIQHNGKGSFLGSQFKCSRAVDGYTIIAFHARTELH